MVFGLIQIWFVGFESPYAIDKLFFKIIALVVTLLTLLETSLSNREEIQGTGWNVKKEVCLVGLGTNTPTPQNQIRKTRAGIIPIHQCASGVQPWYLRHWLPKSTYWAVYGTSLWDKCCLNLNEGVRKAYCMAGRIESYVVQ
jgi:hypothetical protein